MSHYVSTSAFDFLNSFWGETDRVIRDEIIELDDEYQISIELPGISKESIDIEFDKDLLSVTAEKASTTKTNRVLQSNRLYGKVNKNYKIGSVVDRESVKADYADGVLTIKLKKTTDSLLKKIKIT